MPSRTSAIPSAEHGPVAVIDAEAELLAQTAVAAISAWRDAGVTPDGDRRALPGELDLAPGPGRPVRGGHPEHRPARAGCAANERASRPPSPICAWALDPKRSGERTSPRRSDDPLEGSRPMSTKMLSERADDLGQGHQAPGRSSVRTRRLQAYRLRRLDRRRGRRLPRHRPRLPSGPFGPRSAWGRRWTSWTRPDERRTGRPTPTISWPSSRWRRSTRTSPPSNPGFGLPSEGDLPKDRRYTSRRSTRSRAGSGNTSSSTAPPRASFRTG